MVIRSTPPDVEPFFHADSNTWSYVVSDGRVAAVIDPVLDFDAKAARTSTSTAQRLVDHVERNGLEVRWILETHAHADHLSAGHWLKSTHWPDAALAIGQGIRDVQKTFRPIWTARSSIICSGTASVSRSGRWRRRPSRCPAIPATATPT